MSHIVATLTLDVGPASTGSPVPSEIRLKLQEQKLKFNLKEQVISATLDTKTFRVNLSGRKNTVRITRVD